MDRKTRFLSPFSFTLSLGLCALSLALGLSACDDQDLPWSPDPTQNADSTSADAGAETTAPFPAGEPAGTGASASKSQGSTDDCSGAPGGEAPGKGSDNGSPSGAAKGSDDGTSSKSGESADSSGEVESPLNLELWEVLYNPSGSDGLAASPEVLELLVHGPANHKGKLHFELQGQGWSPLSAQDFTPSELGDMRVGSILRIERYKNQNELDKANQQFPLLQIFDPKSGELAVQILRRTGAGLRNKGGWLKIRSGSSGGLQGVVYGEIAREKIDEEVAALWQGPFANPAPSGQALCQIPDSTAVEKHSAAWWTACEASQWGRDEGPANSKEQG